MTLWNPNQLLSITGAARQGEIQCSGINGGNGARCGWQKWSSDPDNRNVQSLLPTLSATPLSKITPAQLLRLAQLCLCRDHHADQKHELATRWQAVVQKHLAQQRPRTPETNKSVYVTAQAAYPSPPSTQPNSSNSSFSIPAEEDEPSAQPASLWNDGASQQKLAAAGYDIGQTQQKLLTAVTEKKMLEGVEKTLRANVESDRAAMAVVEKQLQDAADRLSKLSIENKAVKDENFDLRSAVRSQQKKVVKMEEEAQAVTQRVRDLEKEVGDLSAELEEAVETRDRKVRKLEDLITRLRAEREDAKTQLAQAIEGKQGLEGEARELSAKLEIEDCNVGKLEGLLEKALVEREEARTKLIAVAGEKKTLEGDNAALQREVQRLEVELATERTRVSKLQNHLAVAERENIGREIVPVRKMNDGHGWKGRVQSWLRKLRYNYAGKKPKVSKYEV